MFKAPLAPMLAAFLAGACSPKLHAEDPWEAQFGKIQSATVDDLQIMAPYIGAFRGGTGTFDDGKTEYYFIVKYDWWGGGRQFVKFTVSMVIPSQQRTLVTSEGFYGLDPLTRRLYVFGVFAGNATGRGFVGVFDRDARSHEAWARSVNSDGAVTWVRDIFEMIDEDRFHNRTLVRADDETEWRQVHEDTYVRMNAPAEN